MENLVNSSPLILVLVFLVIGFVFLMKGADFFVEGSSGIAKKLKVPSLIIGLTIVAMGTSLPECAPQKPPWWAEHLFQDAACGGRPRSEKARPWEYAIPTTGRASRVVSGSLWGGASGP